MICNKTRFMMIGFFILCFVISLAVVVATPNSINIQGKLTSSSGTLQTGSFNFTFSIYDNSTNGTKLFEQNITASTDSRGIYDVILKEVNLPFDRQYYLGLKVNSDSEMTPRVNLTSVPYSISANTSLGLNATREIRVGGGFLQGGLTIETDGDIFTNGDIVFSGNITIVNITNMNVNGSILPDIDALFNLGNGTLRWRSANISGTLQASTISAATLLGDGSQLSGISTDFALGWINLTSYPSGCSAGQFITAVGDTLTCGNPGNTSSIAGGWVNVSNDTITDLNLIVTKAGSIAFLVNSSTNRVSIGTGNPKEKLVVIGNVNISGTLNVSGRVSFPDLASCDTIDSDSNGVLSCGSDSGAASGVLGNGNSGNISYWASSTNIGNSTLFQSAGKIGIGTLSPQYAFQIGDNSTKAANLSDVLFIDGERKAVGIGTLSPVNRLDVSGSANITGNLTAFSHKIVCPSNVTINFTPIESAGRQLGCMQANEEGVASWENASSNCFSNYGGSLPSHHDWFISMSFFSLFNETEDWEWVSDIASNETHALAGLNGLTNQNESSTNTSYAYRCWVDI